MIFSIQNILEAIHPILSEFLKFQDFVFLTMDFKFAIEKKVKSLL